MQPLAGAYIPPRSLTAWERALRPFRMSGFVGSANNQTIVNGPAPCSRSGRIFRIERKHRPGDRTTDAPDDPAMLDDTAIVVM